MSRRAFPDKSAARSLLLRRRWRRLLAVPAALSLFCGALAASPGAQARQKARPRPAGPKAASPQSKAPSRTAEKDEKTLARLARALRDQESSAAYARLAEFANARSAGEPGSRAALALGYYDFTKGRHPQAQRWLDRALQRESRLGEYVLYWRAQVNRALGRNAEALVQLEAFRREFPESVMSEQTVESLAESAMALGKEDRAVAALEAYDKVASRPALLLLRAQAWEKAGGSRGNAAAARDYLALYYRFPLSDEAGTAAERIPALQRALGEEFPGVPMEQQAGRATAFYEARRWREARAEYEKLLPKLAGAEHQRAELRIAQCGVQLHAGPGVLAALRLADPELDAERLYALSQAHRSEKQEAEMLAATDQLGARYPQSYWTEKGLFAAGNYFWVNLDRKRAAEFYRRTLEQFPAGRNAQTAQWRLAWVPYLERRPEAASLMEEHLRKFPGSPYTANAFYWLGRASERSGNASHARSFYLKVQERLPQTYFGRQAAERLRVIGSAPVNAAEVLALIPSPPPLPSLEEAVPPAAADRWARAQALRTIACDASAELELHAAYAATGVPRLLWEAGQAAVDAGHFLVGIATVRQVYPQLEARQVEDVPRVVWQTVFPLPFESNLQRAAARNHVDPMLAAGLIRQESMFQADAVSRAGAVGLMQVLPKTGKRLARRLKLRYARARLFNPEYNLALGTLYLADLLKTQDSPEAALAAFNAGEDRVAAWKAERSYEEPAEFVESIPFSETREYVQIVMRNAALYRRLYGKASP